MEKVIIEEPSNLKKYVTTLSCPNLTNKRVDGNTTRQVDFAIQKLFEGYDILVKDHSRCGFIANMHLCNRIMDRLNNEYRYKVEAKFEVFSRRGFKDIIISIKKN